MSDKWRGITEAEARKLLGKASRGMNTEEILNIIGTLTVIAQDEISKIGSNNS